MLKVDPAFLALVIGSGIPLLTGLVTKFFARSHEKALVNLTLSALTGILVQAQHIGGVFSKQTALAAGLAYLVSISTHYGLWKPTGISSLVALVAPHAGIGSADPQLPQGVKA